MTLEKVEAEVRPRPWRPWRSPWAWGALLLLIARCTRHGRGVGRVSYVDARIDKVETSGKVTIDETEYDIESNTYIVGDDDSVIVIDPAHDAEAILKAVGEREVMAVICTDGRDGHRNAVLEVAEADEDDPAPIALHTRDRLLWREIRTPADLERSVRAPGGSIYGTSSNGMRAAFLRPANISPVPGLYLVGGSSHPGGGLPLVGISAEIVADAIGRAS